MNGWLFVLLGLFAAYVILLDIVVVLSVRKFSRPNALLKPVDAPERLNDPRGISEWARNHGYRLLAQFDFDGLIGTGGRPLAVHAWYAKEKKIIFMHYFLEQHIQYEFISNINDKYNLLTSNTKNSLSLPMPPEILLQVFEGMPPGELEQKHIEALDYLCETFDAQVVDFDQPIRQLILDAIDRQMRYIKSLPFWYLRGPWWYLVQRNRLKNQSIIERIERLH